jgi:hypothetical protein
MRIERGRGTAKHIALLHTSGGGGININPLRGGVKLQVNSTNSNQLSAMSAHVHERHFLKLIILPKYEHLERAMRQIFHVAGQKKKGEVFLKRAALQRHA